MGEPCFWACGAYVGDPPENHGIYCQYHKPKPLPEGAWRDKDGVWHCEAPDYAKRGDLEGLKGQSE